MKKPPYNVRIKPPGEEEWSMSAYIEPDYGQKNTATRLARNWGCELGTEFDVDGKKFIVGQDTRGNYTTYPKPQPRARKEGPVS